MLVQNITKLFLLEKLKMCAIRTQKTIYNAKQWKCIEFQYPPPWSESASELHRPSDRGLSAKWLPTVADRGCHVASVTDPYGHILGFQDRSRYFSIKWLLMRLSGPRSRPTTLFFW
jgi:hypothetical protein